MYSLLGFLTKEQIVPLSALQRNPAATLSGGIIRITRNGKEFGIFFTKGEWDDFLEFIASADPAFQKKLAAIAKEKTITATQVFKTNKLK